METVKKRKGKQKQIQVEEKEVPEGSYEYPGVIKVALSETVQILIECKVGVHVNGESTWKNISKEILSEYINLNPETNDFKSIANEILNYPENEILFVYIPEDAAEEDQFYVCTSPNYRKSVEITIEKNEQKFKEKVKSMIYKQPQHWKSCGSEQDIENFTEEPYSRKPFQIEIDAKFQTCDDEIKFKNRNADESIDGYAELIHCGRVEYDLVYKKRLDSIVQATRPTLLKNEQTEERFPTNVWTQYEFLCDADDTKKTDNKSEKSKQTLSANTLIDEVCTEALYNSKINLYDNDMKMLLKCPRLTVEKNEIDFEEVKSFSNPGIYQKYISRISWHPLWTGCFAIAYTSTPRSVNHYKFKQKKDVIEREIFDHNYVYFWSITDDLNPKLILESYREIQTIQFCPHNENLLVAGTINGQIIVWDIKGRLGNVEETEFLTQAQRTHRKFLFSFMYWYKNIKNNSLVMPTVISSMEHSHKGSVTKIEWISPRYRINHMGKLCKLSKQEGHSLQFMSSSEDGSVLFWDLNYRPPLGKKEMKAAKAKRNLRRPSFFSSSDSEYKSLNKIFKPIYQLIVLRHDKRPLPLMDISIRKQRIDYAPVDPNESVKHTIHRRVVYSVGDVDDDTECNQSFAAVTIEGDFFIAEWKGVEYNSNTAINSEICTYLSFRKTHTGPGVSIERSPFIPDLFLTVGGKSVCIWTEKFKDNFLFQRNSHRNYTTGIWSPYNPGLFFVAGDDGVIEIWDNSNRIDLPTYSVNCAGSCLSGMHFQPIRVVQNVIGICELTTSFRVFYIPDALTYTWPKDLDMANTRIDRTQERIECFIWWQENWLKENAELLKKQQDDLEEELRLKEHQKELDNVKRENEQRAHEEQLMKSLKLGEKPQPGKFTEWAEAKWNKQQQDWVYQQLIAKKKLNQDDLIKQQQPLLKTDRQAKVKLEKQRIRLNEKHKVFNEIALNFQPKKLLGISSKYKQSFSKDIDKDSIKQKYIEVYIQTEKETLEYIRNNSYEVTHIWTNVICNGMKRFKSMDVELNSVPKRKYQERINQTNDNSSMCNEERIDIVRNAEFSTDVI